MVCVLNEGDYPVQVPSLSTSVWVQKGLMRFMLEDGAGEQVSDCSRLEETVDSGLVCGVIAFVTAHHQSWGSGVP